MQSALHINHPELLTVYMVLKPFPLLLLGLFVLVRTDNMSVVVCFNDPEETLSLSLLTLDRSLLLGSSAHILSLWGCMSSIAFSSGPDLLSRSQPLSGVEATPLDGFRQGRCIYLRSAHCRQFFSMRKPSVGEGAPGGLVVEFCATHSPSNHGWRRSIGQGPVATLAVQESTIAGAQAGVTPSARNMGSVDLAPQMSTLAVVYLRT